MLWCWNNSLHSDTRGRKYKQPWYMAAVSLSCCTSIVGWTILYLYYIVSKYKCWNWINIGFGCFRESDITKERIQKILASGANVILTTGGIDDMCLKYFVDVGAMAVRRVLKKDLKRIAKSTGGRVEVCRRLCWFTWLAFVLLVQTSVFMF